MVGATGFEPVTPAVSRQWQVFVAPIIFPAWLFPVSQSCHNFYWRARHELLCLTNYGFYIGLHVEKSSPIRFFAIVLSYFRRIQYYIVKSLGQIFYDIINVL